MVSVHRFSARVHLDDPSAVLAHAEAEAAAGDESWSQWLTDYQRGEALIVRLEMTLEIVDGEHEILRVSTPGFFVERNRHAPKVEQQIAELASGEFAGLARQLAARGHDIDVNDLAQMYVHVDLDGEVRKCLAHARAAPRGPRGRA